MLQLYFLYHFQRPHAAGTEFHTAGREDQEGLSVYDNRQGSKDVTPPPSMSIYVNIDKPIAQHTLISSIWSTFHLLSELMFPGKKISPTLRAVLRDLPSLFIFVIMLVTTE